MGYNTTISLKERIIMDMNSVAEYLKQKYNLVNKPNKQEIISWYRKTNEFKSKGYPPIKAAEFAAESAFSEAWCFEERSFEVKTVNDDIETILNVIKGQIK